MRQVRQHTPEEGKEVKRTPPNCAFERAVLASLRRAASALVYCAPAARVMRHRAAAQRER